MLMTLLPLSQIPKLQLAGLKVVLTDIDDTLTLHGRLPAVAFQALENLQKAGLKVIPITGRPAGWCDHIARMWPVDGVVGENGAFYFRYDDVKKKMLRVYAQSASERSQNIVKLRLIADQILAAHPGTAIAADQAYREVDVAIDFAEDVLCLPLSTAQKIANQFQAAGATAKVSSIHVNAWIGVHDKLTMSLRMLREMADINENFEISKIAYLGDSPNDVPMFTHFPLSIGVANVRPYLANMQHHPTYITEGEGGVGFAEFTDAVLAAR